MCFMSIVRISFKSSRTPLAKPFDTGLEFFSAFAANKAAIPAMVELATIAIAVITSAINQPSPRKMCPLDLTSEVAAAK